MAIYAATKIINFSIDDIFNQLIECAGDTDTICSIAGQIIGSKIGLSGFLESLVLEIKKIHEYSLIEMILNDFQKYIK